jgi:hypothetical protein
MRAATASTFSGTKGRLRRERAWIQRDDGLPARCCVA